MGLRWYVNFLRCYLTQYEEISPNLSTYKLFPFSSPHKISFTHIWYLKRKETLSFNGALSSFIKESQKTFGIFRTSGASCSSNIERKELKQEKDVRRSVSFQLKNQSLSEPSVRYVFFSHRKFQFSTSTKQWHVGDSEALGDKHGYLVQTKWIAMNCEF